MSKSPKGNNIRTYAQASREAKNEVRTATTPEKKAEAEASLQKFRSERAAGGVE